MTCMVTYLQIYIHTLSFFATFQHNSSTFNNLWDISRQNNSRQNHLRHLQEFQQQKNKTFDNILQEFEQY